MTEIRRLSYAYALVACAQVDNAILTRARRNHLSDWRQPSEPDDPAHKAALRDVWRVVALCQSPAATSVEEMLSDVACAVHAALLLRASDGTDALNELRHVRNATMRAVYARSWGLIVEPPPWEALGAYVDALAERVRT